MTKNAIRYINDTEAQVTKAFQKNAMIFGTEEFKLWREYKTIFPNAKMSVKRQSRGRKDRQAADNGK